jgi:hypothetical protein
VQALRGAGVAAIWLPNNRFAPRTFPLDALAGHTDLRELDLSQLKLSGKWAPLWQLAQLQQLLLHDPPASFLKHCCHISRLAGLQSLKLSFAGVAQLPAELSALTALTNLNIDSCGQRAAAAGRLAAPRAAAATSGAEHEGQPLGHGGFAPGTVPPD